ncbi:pyridoxamine 5'-phosphate oxidase family protein [Pseudonocardia zijingensis]|jgi:PPOX class probable F420-dependent enzyme|uniref:PPOX class F420-dependent oxidoreductase n=1 Tax=Pseudonocardia zijingensis TaxID=153376 RepID=A0ABP3YLR3_9PSEU
MPHPPLPTEIERFVRAPRPAVIGTVRADGSPWTTATWYDWRDGRVVISMVAGAPRHRNLLDRPAVAMTVLGEDWYDHVSLRGRVTELRDDPELTDLDALSRRYVGTPYGKRELSCVTAFVEIDRWHTWGDPASADNRR